MIMLPTHNERESKMSEKRHVQQLIDFLLSLSFKDIPDKTAERTKLVIMDFFGNALRAVGTNHELIRALLGLSSELGGRPESTILGIDKRINCPDAAMVYGVLGNFLDFSDGHFMGGHVNDRVVPAAITVAEHVSATGREFISAVLAGYEAYVRMGYALFGQVESHSVKAPSFVDLGPLAGSIAAGKLLGLTGEQMTGAMGLAASMQISTGQYTVSGGHEKDLCSGHESRRAVFSALMAKRGVFGSKDILEGDRGLHKVVGGTFDLNSLTEGLGDKFKIEECYFKPYPACRYLHSSIDAAMNIFRDNKVNAGDIEEIRVTTNSSSATRSAKNILSHVSAIFSHQYQVAVVLAEGKPDLPTSWKEKMRKGVVGELIRKTKVENSPEFDNLYRNRTLDCGTWPSHVEVSTKTGEKYGSNVLRPKGDPTNPMSLQELKNKFRNNALRMLGESEAHRVMQKILELERVSDIRRFLQGLAGQINMKH
jgi:2-methylcitrate dehydratase PrpD